MEEAKGLGIVSDEEKAIMEGLKTGVVTEPENDDASDDNDDKGDSEEGDETPATDTGKVPLAITKAKPSDDDIPDIGIDFDALSAEYFANDGKLSEETYMNTMRDAKKAGIPTEMVDIYFTGLAVTAGNIRSAAMKAAGGEAEYAKIADWASKSLSAEDLDAYNEASKTAAGAKLAAAGLRAQYEAATGQARQHNYAGDDSGNSPNTPAAGGTEGVTSRSELIKLTQTKEYQEDSAAGHRFRSEVHSKLARSLKKGQYSQLG